MTIGFQVRSLNQMLTNLSQSATWEKASLCPCKVKRTGGADTQCPICRGNSIIWAIPIGCRVSLQSMKTNRDFAMFTAWEKGDIMVTLISDSDAYDAGEFDRFTLMDSKLRLDQVLTRGSSDTIKYSSVVGIDEAWGIVNGLRVDLTQGVDFTLTNNLITWLTNVLPIGNQYSLMYVAHPQYYVYRDLVMDRPHGSRTLPRKVHLRLMELFSRALVVTQ